MADPISSFLNIGIANPGLPHLVEREEAFPLTADGSVNMISFPQIPYGMSGQPEMNTINYVPKAQFGTQREFENPFGAINVPHGQQMLHPGITYWGTPHSRAGVAEGTNPFPMSELEANQVLTTGGIAYSGDVGMEDGGWLDDLPADWSMVLDPELAIANHSATMADIADRGDDGELTTYDAIDQAPHASTVFDHSYMDFRPSDNPGEYYD